jgi:hypothetical protein
VWSLASRLSLGASTLPSYLSSVVCDVHRPDARSAAWSAARLQRVVEQHCCVAEDYDAMLRTMWPLYDPARRLPTCPPPLLPDARMPVPLLLQLPLDDADDARDDARAAASASIDDKAREDRRALQRARMRALMSTRKQQKLAADQALLADWDAVRSAAAEGSLSHAEFTRQIKKRAFEDEEDFLSQSDASPTLASSARAVRLVAPSLSSPHRCAPWACRADVCWGWCVCVLLGTTS